MSDIDIVAHYRIGRFATLPIYMAREDGCWLGSKCIAEPSSVMRKGDLTIGGGSGEHAALVIHQPTHCVARFLHDFFPQDASRRSFPSAVDPTLFTFCNNFLAREWIQEFDAFYSHWSDTLSFIDWVAIEVGQFIYHALPEFYDAVPEWRGIYGDLDVQFTMCGISWDRYLGNGSEMFRCVRDNP